MRAELLPALPSGGPLSRAGRHFHVPLGFRCIVRAEANQAS